MRPAAFIGIWALCGVLAPVMGWAKKAPPKPLPVKLTAEIANRFNWDFKKDDPWEDTSQTTLDMTAQLKYLPNPVVQVVVGEWIVDGKIRPYNNYLNLAFNHVNLRLGNQIVRWGKADEISPLDVVNPEDLTRGFTRPRADRKIPTPIANMEFLTDVVSLQGIYIPFFESSEFHYTDNDWALFGHLDKTAPTFSVSEEIPAQTLRDAGYGGRLTAAIGRVDVAFVYLNHRRNLPSMKPYPFSIPGDPNKKSTPGDLVAVSTTTGAMPAFHYLREELYGLEFETTVGSVGLRGDASYVSSQSFITATLQEQRRPVITGVLGFDYNGPNNFYINCSASHAQIQDYDESLAPNDESTSSMSGNLSWELLSGNIKLSYLGIFNLTDKSFFHNPKVNLNFIPNVGLEAGVDIYGGPPSTQIGFYDGNDQGYLSLSYFF
ncbi:MAG: hypothetical protein KBD85_03305 [Elusimicrobia bacterium]|nr:hypothetical protein [Elusimicrobiota bacterium]MBP9699025.1 hypothetical protein [Elusimicrobiota bacterium]